MKKNTVLRRGWSATWTPIEWGIELRAPYREGFKRAISRLPKHLRYWDRDARCWVVHWDAADEALAALERYY